MGPHNSLLTAEERWKVVTFVQKLQNPNAVPSQADSTAAGKNTPATAAENGTASAVSNTSTGGSEKK